MATASTAEAPAFQLSGSRQGSRKAGQGGSKGQSCSSISTVASTQKLLRSSKQYANHHDWDIEFPDFSTKYPGTVGWGYGYWHLLWFAHRVRQQNQEHG